MTIKFKKNLIGFLGVLFFFSCSEESKEHEDKKRSFQIIANTEDKEYFIWYNDSNNNVYNFYPNRKLRYYINSIYGEMNGEAVYFFENGSVEAIINCKNGKKHGIVNKFFPSGNLKSTKFYVNDSLRGYYVDYFDKYNCKKSEFLSSCKAENSYIYKRMYDSASQKVISILDHRHLEIEMYPDLKMDDLRMPWEK